MIWSSRRDPQDRWRRGRAHGLPAGPALVERRKSRSRRPTAVRRRTSSTTSAGSWRSKWTTGLSLSPGPGTSLPYPAGTTPGSSATSRGWSSTGRRQQLRERRLTLGRRVPVVAGARRAAVGLAGPRCTRDVPTRPPVLGARRPNVSHRAGQKRCARSQGKARVACVTFWLFVFGVVLAVYGLADDRDVVVLAGAFVTASAVAINRIGGGRGRRSKIVYTPDS